MDLGLLLAASSPLGLARLVSASLSLGSALHLRLPPDAPSRAASVPIPSPAPLSRWSGFASIRHPQRTLTSISVSMLDAPPQVSPQTASPGAKAHGGGTRPPPPHPRGFPWCYARSSLLSGV